MFDILIGNLGNEDILDIHLGLIDEVQQQIQRSIKVLQRERHRHGSGTARHHQKQMRYRAEHMGVHEI